MAIYMSLLDKVTGNVMTVEHYKDHLGQEINVYFSDSRKLYELELGVLWRDNPLITFTGGSVPKMIKAIIRESNLSHLNAIQEFIIAEIKDRKYREENTKYAKDCGALDD